MRFMYVVIGLLAAFAFGGLVSLLEGPGDQTSALLWPYAVASGVTALLAVYAAFRLRLD